MTRAQTAIGSGKSEARADDRDVHDHHHRQQRHQQVSSPSRDASSIIINGSSSSGGGGTGRVAAACQLRCGTSNAALMAKKALENQWFIA